MKIRRFYLPISGLLVLLLFRLHPVIAVNQAAPDMIQKILQPWKGDFNGMAKRGYLRALVIYSKTFYFLDGPDQHGIAYDALEEFEKEINVRLKTDNVPFNIAIIPVRHDQLFPYLVEGKGDLALGNLTITPDREKLVDFSDPVLENVSEILITGEKSPVIKTINDLSGKEIFVRPSSSYFEHLQNLNEKFKQTGKPPIKLKLADEELEDEDILEMVNAGVVSMTVVDDSIANFWAQIFPKIKVNKDIIVNTKGDIAWAFRKNSPELQNVVNSFVKTHGKGTMFGNVLFKRYLQNTDYIRNPGLGNDMERFRETIAFFKKYANQYSFDWLMVEAQAYQESRLNQSMKSSVGAIGIMQVLPSTAASKEVDIPDIHIEENNIHAGVKYMDFMMNQYFKDAKMDQLNRGLFAFASYNAGPAKITALRDEARQMGLNPDVWFNNVEIVAARRIGQQTVTYVRNIYKYYVSYKLVMEQMEERKEAEDKAQPQQ